MLEDQLRRKGIRDSKVLAAMRTVPRERFVGPGQQAAAYADGPLPIGDGQTISQPFIVAYMTEALEPREADTVLEVGAGSGYQAAILARIVKHVHSVEVIPRLAEMAKKNLRGIGCENVEVHEGDGFAGWPEAAPFDKIIVTAAPRDVPPALVRQLAAGGRLVLPVGPPGGTQDLVLLVKDEEGQVAQESLCPVRFVPMVKSGER